MIRGTTRIPAFSSNNFVSFATVVCSEPGSEVRGLPQARDDVITDAVRATGCYWLQLHGGKGYGSHCITADDEKSS